MKITKSLKSLLLTPAMLAFSFSYGQDYTENIKNFLRTDSALKTATQELKDFKIVDVDPSSSLKGDVVTIQQKVNGIPVFGKVSTFLMRDNAIAYSKVDFATLVTSKNIPSQFPKIDEKTALNNFLTLGKFKNSNKYFIGNKKNDKYAVPSSIYYLPEGNNLFLTYRLEVNEIGTQNVYQVFVDAETGKIIRYSNIVISEHLEGSYFGHGEEEKNGTKTVAYPLQQNAYESKNSLLQSPTPASYRVFPLPTEAPSFGDRKLVTSPWDLTASPLGWQSDGTNNYTITKGNNIDCYADLYGDDSVGETADGGANLNFDFPLDINKPASTYTKASITNLFYSTNMAHDIFYRFGYTETARNTQTNNFDKGGLGDDEIIAQAQDSSFFNNANLQPKPDGVSPILQMFLFSPKFVNGSIFNSPNSLKDYSPNTYYAIDGMGPELDETGITADLVITDPIQGCSNLNNTNLAGKIAYIQRGDCNFVDKVKNAQSAGAIGVVIYCQPSTVPVGSFGQKDSLVEIPSILLDAEAGGKINSALAAGETVNAKLYKDKSKFIYIDSSLDNGVLLHEYTHSVSNRLTGSGDSCLNYFTDNEQMGEGWSDYFALLMTMKPTDNSSVARGMGTFAFGEEPSGQGIRLAKYSPDFSINNYTYGKTNGMTVNSSLLGLFPMKVPDDHAIGFIWASMLWDLTWKYVDKYGFSNDLVNNPNSGTARVFQLVLDALKLQPCGPNFVQGRDAIIAADKLQTGGENKCLIWNVFAKRGLGINADPGEYTKGYWLGDNPDTPEMNDQVEDFNVPNECKLAVNDINSKNSVSIYPNPAKNEIFVKTAENKTGKAFIKIYDMSGRIVLDDYVNLGKDSSINVSKLDNGVYILKGEGIGTTFTEKIVIKK